MGYWSDSNTAVVTKLIDAGPAAERGSHYFEPDQKWQLTEIARHYERSGRRETYLGDWHSHPAAQNGKLSRKDCTVLRRIITTPEARALTPLMAVFNGKPSEWELTVWRAELRPRRFLRPKLTAAQARLRVF